MLEDLGLTLKKPTTSPGDFRSMI
ncbi:hypothetical protein BLA29_014441 [Euroglyphus maynei]|uniref:Uncharacterized protein n=1 Tax=Euroglyphus maynei TaxID=6958 RepID=A0A1Y3BA90_EURMA|nr:hypothetical protein BLA29_014441 [Euroglyphus maynei]